MRRLLLLALPIVALFLLLSTSGVARAEPRGWVEGRADVYGGSSDLFERFDNRVGLGIEAGFDLAITLFGEALFMGTDQYLFSANLGIDGVFGEKARFTIGGYTGPFIMVFPPSPAPTGVDFSGLPAEQQQALIAAGGHANLDEVEAEFDAFAAQEEDLGRTALGWNLIRGRAAFDVRLTKGVYLGIAAQLAYHLLISGEDAAAGAKNEAVDKFAADNGIDPGSEIATQVRTAVGARPVDKDALDGFNYDLHAYFRLEM